MALLQCILGMGQHWLWRPCGAGAEHLELVAGIDVYEHQLYLIFNPDYCCRLPNKAVEEDVQQQAYADRDRDGFSSDVDCDDTDYKVYPDATEICDGIDNDCDGEVDEQVRLTYYADKDEDGFGAPEDSISACSPPAGYVPFANDCDDFSPEIYTGAQERCNELDDDCDGEIDEGLVLGMFYDADGDGYGDPERRFPRLQRWRGLCLLWRRL